MSLQMVARRVLLSAVAAVTRRHPVLLPREAADPAAIVGARAPYRVDRAALTIELTDERQGDLVATLLAYRGHFATDVVWQSRPVAYRGATTLHHDLNAGTVVLGAVELGRGVPAPSTRRFCWELALTTGGRTARRRLAHFRDWRGHEVDAGYYHGDDYVDYGEQAAGESAVALPLLARFAAASPVLEVGCATGLMLQAIREAGLDAIGVDSAEWAVSQANARLGIDSAFRCDVESDPLPRHVLDRAPFGALVLWAVLEHFRAPFAVVDKLTRLVRPGAPLVLTTTNAASLTHWLFGPKWEGYFDWTHHGVEAITIETLTRHLDAAGWRIEYLHTDLVWTGDTDPAAASLRDWWTADARFRSFVVDSNLGDFITCVAVKR